MPAQALRAGVSAGRSRTVDRMAPPSAAVQLDDELASWRPELAL